MKHSIRLIYTICILLLSVTVAAASDTSSKDLLLGKWSGSATNARGDIATTTFEIKSDATFSGEADMNHKPFMIYSGTWTFNGKDLVWSYTKSSIPLPDAAKIDTDEVVSVDASTLVLSSKLSGQQRVFRRSK
jgi:hypothetical protein